MSGSWNRFWRCITALTVSGRSSSRVHFATSSFFSCAFLKPATRSATTGSLPWKLICTWHSPASASAASFSRVSSTADVMRLEYSPTSLACWTSSTRSLRAVGSPPEKWICSTPISASSVRTFFHSSVESSLPPRSSSTGLEQYGHCSGQRCVSSASTASGMPNVSAVEPRLSSTASPSEGSLAATPASVSVGLMTSSRALRSEIPCRQGPAAWR